MLLSKRAKNLLEKKEGKEREKRERKIEKYIDQSFHCLDIVVKNLLNFYLQSMGFAEAGLER